MDYVTTSKGTKVWIGSCWRFSTEFGEIAYALVRELRHDYLIVDVISDGKVQHRTSTDADFIDQPFVSPITDEDEDVALALLGAA